MPVGFEKNASPSSIMPAAYKSSTATMSQLFAQRYLRERTFAPRFKRLARSIAQLATACDHCLACGTRESPGILMDKDAILPRRDVVLGFNGAWGFGPPDLTSPALGAAA